MADGHTGERSGGRPDGRDGPRVDDKAELLSRMSDGYLSLDGNWRILEANDAGYEALARVAGGDPDPTDLRGRVLWSLVEAPEGTRLHEEFHRAATGTQVEFEADIDGLDGWFEFRVYPDEDGVSVFFTPVAVEAERRRVIEQQASVIGDLYEIFQDDTRDVDATIRSLLALGRRALDTEYGTLSRVDGNAYVFEWVDCDDDAITPGTEVDLSWTSCELVVADEKRLVLSDMLTEAPEVASRPGNVEFGLSCYIGTPVEVDDEIYGTLCFYDREPRSEPFSEWEAGLIELMGVLVGYELQHRDTERRLRARNEQLEEFRSVLTHDLRNPVTVAKGYLDLVEDTGDRDALGRTREALDRIDAIIDDVSTVVDVRASGFDSEPVETADVARDAWAMVDGEDASLDATAEGVVSADRSHMQRLLENLLANAVAHTDGPVRVRVGDLPDGFYVADDGGGVDPDRRQDVFESGITTGGGTGLGLAIVAEIAEAHDWSYEITASATGGARFEFTDTGRS